MTDINLQTFVKTVTAKTDNGSDVIFRTQEDIALPPFEKWSPDLCINASFKIDVHGNWYHNEAKLDRVEMVCLFARVLIKQDDFYFLKTPHELIRIEVEDLPFVITTWEIERSESAPKIIMTTNVGERYEVNENFELVMDSDSELNSLESPLSLNIKNGLRARLSRNVYYQLIEEMMTVRQKDGKEKYFIVSGKHEFEVM